MSSKRSPRAMPMEAIVTRNKAKNQQFTRELRRNPITPVPKRKPPKQRVEKKEPKKPSKVSDEGKETVGQEYYPNRLKRKMGYKKVVLAPKPCMKVIGRTNSCNKRKLHMPQKEVKRPRRDSTSSVLSDIEPMTTEHKVEDEEMNIKDMVLLIEEEGGLNDEDLLEILTCPSPVWWEDPPDGYIEEPIFVRPKPEEQKSIKNQLLEEQKKEAERRKLREEKTAIGEKQKDSLDVTRLDISIENRDINFKNKRCKLESLLGSIRNKFKGLNNRAIEDKTEVRNKTNENTNQNLGADLKLKEIISIGEDLDENKINKNFKSIPKDDNVSDNGQNYMNDGLISDQITPKESNHNSNEDTTDSNIKNEKGTDILDSMTNKNRRNEFIPKTTVRNRKDKTNSRIKATSKENKIKKIIKKRENTIKNLEVVFETKEIVTIDDDIDKNVNVEPLSKIDDKYDKDDTNNEDNPSRCSREKKCSESFEDDLLELEEEILNLENIEIPIAQNNTQPTETVNLETSTSHKSLNEPVKENYSHGKESSNKKLKVDNTKTHLNINNEIKNNVSFIRVRNFDTLISKNFNNYADSDSFLKTDDDLNKSSASKTSEKHESNRLNTISPLLMPIACIEIPDEDNINRTNDTSSPFKNIGVNDTCILSESEITIDNEEDRNITNARRNSIDSATSEKNMSVEYLDMNLLDEDENKTEPESQNEFTYESEYCQSQSDSQSTKNNLINFKSDLDMSDTNMYNEINESCNSDIFKYIRDNQKLDDTIYYNKRSNDFLMKDNLKSAIKKNVISDKNIPIQETEYVEVYKVVTSDSESECNSNKINEENSVEFRINNKINKNNEIKENVGNERKVTENIADSEAIAYEEEYLIEFDEMQIIGNDNAERNLTDKTNDTTLNINNEVNLINVDESKNSTSKSESHKVYLSKGNSNKFNELPKTDKIENQNGSINADSLKIHKHLKNYYKHRKDIRNTNKIDKIISNDKSKYDTAKKIDCKSCNFKNKSILISESETVKYCLLCSSIYDTDNCKYCIKKLKKQCSCTNVVEYACDKCALKVTNKEAMIDHIKQTCNKATCTNP